MMLQAFFEAGDSVFGCEAAGAAVANYFHLSLVYNMSKLINLGYYCSDWSPIRIQESKRKAVEYIAYCFWEEAGRPNGKDLEFWAMAEECFKLPSSCIEL